MGGMGGLGSVINWFFPFNFFDRARGCFFRVRLLRRPPSAVLVSANSAGMSSDALCRNSLPRRTASPMEPLPRSNAQTISLEAGSGFLFRPSSFIYTFPDGVDGAMLRPWPQFGNG